MFDAKIQQLADKLGEQLDDKFQFLCETMSDWTVEVEHMSRNMKIAIGISLGLSVADTILLFAILMKLRR